MRKLLKRNFKKLMSVILAFCMCLSGMATVYAGYELGEAVQVPYEEIGLAQDMLSDLRKFEDRPIILRELFVGTNELWVRKPLYRLRDGGVSE